MCRKVCTTVIQKRPPMVGTHLEPIQIDEARFVGKWRYNRRRLLDGDEGPHSEDSDVEVENMRNHGRRIDGPWVFGLKQGDDWRYFRVERRDKATLIPIIQRECALGLLIHSDEWPAYKCLSSLRFEHDTVNFIFIQYFVRICTSTLFKAYLWVDSILVWCKVHETVGNRHWWRKGYSCVQNLIIGLLVYLPCRVRALEENMKLLLLSLQDRGIQKK